MVTHVMPRPYSQFVDTRPADDFLVRATVSAYPGITCPVPSNQDLQALRRLHKLPVDCAAGWLVAAIGGQGDSRVHAALHWPLLRRVFREHFWGADLFEEVAETKALYYEGPPALALESGLCRPPKGTVLRTWRPMAAVLYTLARLGWCEGLGPIEAPHSDVALATDRGIRLG